jgi:pSer/pThr/pTyr-binding forkhead associated (FHA) protein
MQPVPVADTSHITRIEVRSKGKPLSEHVFGPGRVIVGRSSDNEIFIKSKFVSRHHAQLTFDETGCVIEDLNSTNGVYLNEKRIKKVRLESGDSVSLGIHDLVYFDLRRESDDDAVDDSAGNLSELQG